jgi:hypothetical protein
VNTCPDGFECSEKYGNLCIDKPEPKPQTSGDGGASSSSSDGGDAESDGGCAISTSRLDPTKPVPWKSGVLVLGAALAAFSRWGRKRPQTPGSCGALAARRRRRN